ncbi:hypothetical protein Hs30E_06230 [Lactococcus hodotermopsidis]|uniref:Uncharacterized protein n=1 Tax=Pseudolactococcus hodotermopsidis TaxID=2709157 RepID=A0A6A0B9M7_9LACT|nr:hypothetical protein [Lactococcus hodotermopsidis]GFH42072.1 hypothetical protein Hs30E_06230 [Lactococcus hodotermopsidis]
MTEKNQRTHKESLDSVKVIKTVGATPAKVIGQFFGRYVVVIIAIIILVVAGPFAIKIMGWSLQTLNPAYLQKQVIADFNNSKDAYSTIEGTKVAKVPLNGIEKLFSQSPTSSDTIIISIPKVLNISPIFNDDTEKSQDLLRNAWIESVNSDKLTKEAKYYEIMYNGSVIITGDNKGNETKNGDLNAIDKKEITQQLKSEIKHQTKYEFQKWDVVGKREDVKFEKNKNIVTVDGYFIDKNITPNWVPKFGKPIYHVRAEFKHTDNKLEFISGSLKVSKK